MKPTADQQPPKEALRIAELLKRLDLDTRAKDFDLVYVGDVLEPLPL